MEQRRPNLLSVEKKRDFFHQLDAFLSSGGGASQRQPCNSNDGQQAYPPREHSAPVMTNEGALVGRGDIQEFPHHLIVIDDAEDNSNTPNNEPMTRTLPTASLLSGSKRRASPTPTEKPSQKRGKTPKGKRADASVDSHDLVLHGQHVLFVPIGSDVSRKRLEIWRDMVETLGGTVVSHDRDTPKKAQQHASLLHLHTQPNRDSGEVGGSTRELKHDADFDWNGVDIVVVSVHVDAARLQQYYHFPYGALPSHLKLVTPEWLVYVRHEKKLPEDETPFAWRHEIARLQQDTQKDKEREAEEIYNDNDDADESDVDNDGSDRKNMTTKEIVRAPPVRVDMEKFRHEEEELQKKKIKLVNERIPIFHQLNPRFETIANASEGQNVKMEAFVCQESSVMQSNLNAHLTDPLEELMEFLHVERDIWREYSYKKVVSSLKAMRTRVSSVRDLRGLWWAKGRMRDKVVEVLETGKVEKLEAKKTNPRLRTLVEISRIWGVGPVTAAKLYNMGYNTMDALKEHADEVLNFQQQIGLKHYHDFRTTIPRAEVVEIEKTVVDEIRRLLPNATALACGSYRRGRLSSGDVDILITDPDSEECDILPTLLRRLHEMKFLTDDLTHISDHHMGRCDSYMGVCRLRADLPFRRLDIKVYPRRYFGFALLYFTGSDHFNRSIRLFARKKGWSLSDRFLKRVMRVRKGVKLEAGESVVCPEEVDVFIALGLEYKDPTERNCFDIRFLEEDEAHAKKRKTTGDHEPGHAEETIPIATTATAAADEA